MQTKDKIIEIIIAFLITISIFAIVFFGLGFIVMLLWNWLMPVIFGLTTITIWQSFGLILLSSLLLRFKILIDHEKPLRTFKDYFNS